MKRLHCTLLALATVQLTACAVVDDFTTGNWTNWGCESKMHKEYNYTKAAAETFCNDSRANTQKSWAKANNLPEDHSWGKDAASKLKQIRDAAAAAKK